MNVELDEKSMGMTCENIDVMGGIMHIKKIKYTRLQEHYSSASTTEDTAETYLPKEAKKL